MTALPRWLRKLRPSGRRLLARVGPAASKPVRYGIHPDGDRRRRAVATITATAVRQACADGLIEAEGEGWVLSRQGRQALDDSGCRPGEGGPAKRVLADIQIADDAGRLQTHTINLAESPLYKFLGQLDSAEIAAGERYRRDYLQSTLSQLATSDWLRLPGPRASAAAAGPDAAPVCRLQARARILDTREKLGARATRLMDALLIEEESLAALERRFGWSARSGRSVVRFALSRLAEIYGLNRG